MPRELSEPKQTEDNPEELTRLLELELMQKRMAWQQASARHKTIKSLSFFFLFVMVMVALVGFYLVFSRVNQQRANRPPAPNPSATPA